MAPHRAPMPSPDAIVVGLGAHGSAAALALARRGLRVLALEQFARGHELGSSGGRSRMIRRAYFEDPAYVPLLAAAREGWSRLSDAAGEPMIEVTGGLYLGHPGSEVVARSIASAVDQGIEHEVVGADEIRRRWPAFAVEADVTGLFDPGAGMIRPERAIGAQLAEAERIGAELRFGERVVGWRPSGGGIEIETERDVIAAGALVIAAGAWTRFLLPDLALPLEVERQAVVWFEVEAGASSTPDLDRLPVWIFETDTKGAFYGFANEVGLGLKVARHHSEDVVADPDTLDRVVRPADVERIRAFARRHLPAAAGAPVRESLVCLYTNTPDRNFVIDRHPNVPGVAFASACSGHGFKFAPVVGEILADLALTGSTRHDVSMFNADRFAATS